MNIVWTLAGHDPNATAGLQADQAVGHALKTKIRCLMTTFTAQNDSQVKLSAALPLAWLKAQWNCLLEQETPAAIKLGLISSEEQLRFLAAALEDFPNLPIIADPVLAASSGYPFTDAACRKTWIELLPRLSLLTPNRPEAEQLLGYALDQDQSIIKAAAELRSWGLAAVLIKGGHGDDPQETRDYFDDGHRAFWLKSPRVGRNYRGTGCSLATAIACYRASGLNLREAVVLGHAFLQTAIQQSAAQISRYLEYPSAPTQLGQLSYQTSSPHQAAPAMNDGPIGFYPIVPDLPWLYRLGKLGIRTIQLRIKDKSRDELVPILGQAVDFCQSRGIRLFINDHWELAAVAGAYGAHLGQEDLDLLSPAEFNQLLQSGLRLGISTHSYEEAARAIALRPSYIAFGPIFHTSCKSLAFGPQGTDRIIDWLRWTAGIPLVVIGGIKLSDIKSIRDLGVDGVSAIADILTADNPDERAQQWLEALS